jgi:hypothetical protein
MYSGVAKMINSGNSVFASTAGLLFVGYLVSSLPAYGQENETTHRTQELTATIAGKYAIYAMIASNTYHKKTSVRFPVELLGWVQVDVDGKPTNHPVSFRVK